LREQRLVTLVDGNRVETATDLTASLSMVDVNDIERVEVIKGAQSSLYGTGAMGGIINSNVSRALLYGFDLGLEYNLYNHFVFFGSAGYVVARDTEADTYLPLIPPMNGRAGIRYSHRNTGSMELSVRGAARQDKIAEGETQTEGYYRVDLALNTRQFNLSVFQLQFFSGIDNLTDVSYTNHLATNRGDISIEPGRNIYVRLNLLF
jgi:hemoglobin/transferrin/lactoferrin receptor protein